MTAYWRASLIAALVAAGLILLFGWAARPSALGKPVIILVYPGVPPTNDPFRGFAEAFADTFRADGLHVTVMPCSIMTATDRRDSVRRITATCRRFPDSRRIIVVAWSSASWPAEVAALDGARIAGIVSIGGIHDLDGPTSAFVRHFLLQDPHGDQASPIHRDLSGLPPILLLQCSRDPYVPAAQSERFLRHAVAAGCVARMRILDTPEHCPTHPAGRRLYHDVITRWLSHGV